MNLPVLMYHDVYINSNIESGFQNSTASLYKISYEEFKSQVFLIVDFIKKNYALSSEYIFTFDDGGNSFYNNIAPVLDEYNQKGIFFISTKYINSEKFLSEKEILDLHLRGHIIASHSHSHPDDLSVLDEVTILKEWEMSIEILSNIIGEKVIYASVPNGFCSDIVIKAAEKCGIKYLYTSFPTCKIEYYNNMAIIGRYAIQSKMSSSVVCSILTNKISRFRLEFKWQVLSLLKFVLGSSYIKIRSLLINER